MKRYWLTVELVGLVLLVSNMCSVAEERYSDMYLEDNPYFDSTLGAMFTNYLPPSITYESIVNETIPEVFYNNFQYLLIGHNRYKKTDWYYYLNRIGEVIYYRTDYDPKEKLFVNDAVNLTDYSFTKINEWYEDNKYGLTLDRLRELGLYVRVYDIAASRGFDVNYASVKMDSLLSVIESDSRVVESLKQPMSEPKSCNRLDSIIESEDLRSKEVYFYEPRKQKIIIEREISTKFFQKLGSNLKRLVINSSGNDVDFGVRVLIGELSKYINAGSDVGRVCNCDKSGVDLPTEYECGKMLDWLEEHKNSFTLDRMRELLRLKREIDYADFKGIDSSKYHQRVDSLFNVMELESVRPTEP